MSDSKKPTGFKSAIINTYSYLLLCVWPVTGLHAQVFSFPDQWGNAAVWGMGGVVLPETDSIGSVSLSGNLPYCVPGWTEGNLRVADGRGYSINVWGSSDECLLLPEMRLDTRFPEAFGRIGLAVGVGALAITWHPLDSLRVFPLLMLQAWADWDCACLGFRSFNALLPRRRGVDLASSVETFLVYKVSEHFRLAATLSGQSGSPVWLRAGMEYGIRRLDTSLPKGSWRLRLGGSGLTDGTSFRPAAGLGYSRQRWRCDVAASVGARLPCSVASTFTWLIA